MRAYESVCVCVCVCVCVRICVAFCMSELSLDPCMHGLSPNNIQSDDKAGPLHQPRWAVHVVTSHAAMQTKLFDSTQSTSAAAVFGPEGSDSVLYSSPLMQDKLIEYNHKQSNVLRCFGMQHHVTALSIAVDGSLVAYADANGTVGYMQYKSGSHTILAGKVAILNCSVLVSMMIMF